MIEVGWRARVDERKQLGSVSFQKVDDGGSLLLHSESICAYSFHSSVCAGWNVLFVASSSMHLWEHETVAQLETPPNVMHKAIAQLRCPRRIESNIK